jgi:cell wall-associated NlpC family hydrolase
VHLVYKERKNIILPDIEGYHAECEGDWKKVSAVMEAESERWKQIVSPKEYDVILMRRGPLACHVGVCVGSGQMLHINEGINSTIEPYNGIRWGKRIVGFYRYA